MDYRTKKTYPRRYHPMLVSNSGTDERMDGQTSLKLWEAFDLLPEETRRVVAADEVAEKMKKLQDTFQIEDSAIGKITLLIRRLFFGEINISKMEIEIGNVFAQISPEKINQVKNVVQFIQGEILTIKPQPRRENSEDEAEKQIKIEKLTLEKALLQYPKLGEQSITSNPLKLRYFPTPVRSSIKNWITDYHDCLGAGKHSTMDRGNYLFHSENGKKLTPVERQKVSLVLKSLDEETLLDIDSAEERIVFNVVAEAPVRESRLVDNLPVQEIRSVEQQVNRQNNQFAPAPMQENRPVMEAPMSQGSQFMSPPVRQNSQFMQPPVRESKPSAETSQIEKVQAPAKVMGGSNYDFANSANQQEDVAQARIRQSLNFSNLKSQQVTKDEAAAKLFNFEDSDYASKQREKISANSSAVAKFGTLAIDSKDSTEIEKPIFGSFSFSSAQKLPVEKKVTNLDHGFSYPADQAKVEAETTVKTWNSPDFKKQISQDSPAQVKASESVQNNAAEEKQPTRARQGYSPYVIVPSHYKEKGAPDVYQKNDPKIQGNMVDLS